MQIRQIFETIGSIFCGGISGAPVALAAVIFMMVCVAVGIPTTIKDMVINNEIQIILRFLLIFLEIFNKS